MYEDDEPYYVEYEEQPAALPACFNLPMPPEDFDDHSRPLNLSILPCEYYGYSDYDAEDEFEEMNVYHARPTAPFKPRPMDQEDETQEEPHTPSSLPEQNLDPITHIDEEGDDVEAESGSLSYDDEGLPGFDDNHENDKGETEEEETHPAIGHSIEEGNSSCLKLHVDDSDDIGIVLGCKNDDENYIQPTAPTIQEYTDVQEAIEEKPLRIEIVLDETVIKAELMPLEEQKGVMNAARKTRIVYTYPPTTYMIFSVTRTTPNIPKTSTGDKILEPLCHDFSPLTYRDVSTQNLVKYMEWLCTFRLTLMISMCETPYDLQETFWPPRQVSRTDMI